MPAIWHNGNLAPWSAVLPYIRKYVLLALIIYGKRAGQFAIMPGF
jgi:hypothetical protein